MDKLVEPSKISPIKLSRGFAAKAERLSLEMRSRIGLEPYDPLCAFRLCEFLNIKVLKLKDLVTVPQATKETLSIPQGKYWSAFAFPCNKSGITVHTIVHNELHVLGRQQSDIMHEIGHILCKHESYAIDVEMGFPAIMRLYPKEQELEAECLGSTLQIPREALFHAVKQGMSIGEIANHYLATLQMVQFRLNKTGVKRQLGIR